MAIVEQPKDEDRAPEFIRARLAEVHRAGRYRSPPVVASEDGVRGTVDGQPALLFCSNDYLGLRRDGRLAEAAARAVRTQGAGAGSSRLIAGSLPIHQQLEEVVADWLGSETALVCSSGYQANLGLLQGLATQADRIVSDALNHASIIDGCRLSRAAVTVLPHGDTRKLQDALAVEAAGQTFVVGEGLYSMDGDRGPVVAWADAVARYSESHLLVDEAHSLGVFGPAGAGVCAEVGQVTTVLARVGTFGKALGSHGAVIATDRATRDLLVNTARTYIFSTALPPAAAGAALGAISIVRSAEGADLRSVLAARTRQFREGLAVLGMAALGEQDSPIVPLVVGSEERTMAASAALLHAGVYAMGIRPPTVAEGTCRLRFTLSSAHTEADVDRALEAVELALVSP